MKLCPAYRSRHVSPERAERMSDLIPWRDLLLFRGAAGAQAGAKRGEGEDAARKPSQHKCRILRRVLTAALGARGDSGHQRDSKRNRKDGFFHCLSFFCLGPRPVTSSLIGLGCTGEAQRIQGRHRLCLEYVMSEYGREMASVNSVSATKVSFLTTPKVVQI